MSIFTRRPILSGAVIAGASLMLLPITYLAGWMGDLGQVQPELTALAKAHQRLNWQTARQPSEPPLAAPSVNATWTDATVTLSWSKVPKAASYTIYRGSASTALSGAEAIATVTQHTPHPSYTDATVTSGRRYVYWVAANNAAGRGPASSASYVRVYLSWNAVAQTGIHAARLGQATQWSKRAWGLLGNSRTVVAIPIWNVSGTLETPAVVPTLPSTWLTERGTQWALNNSALTAHREGAVTVFHGAANAPRLNAGQATSQDLALWRQDGHWTQAMVASPFTTLPPDALILNQYGQAVGFTTASGQLTRTASRGSH